MTELLEDRTLRESLADGALPQRRALEYAAQPEAWPFSRTVLARLAPQGFSDQYPDLPWFEKRLRRLLRALDGLARDARR